jgi:hypothetical protein
MAGTTTVGGMISGYSVTGSKRSEIAPTTVMSTESTPAKMGRLMKNWLKFTTKIAKPV